MSIFASPEELEYNFYYGYGCGRYESEGPSYEEETVSAVGQSSIAQATSSTASSSSSRGAESRASEPSSEDVASSEDVDSADAVPELLVPSDEAMDLANAALANPGILGYSIRVTDSVSVAWQRLSSQEKEAFNGETEQSISQEIAALAKRADRLQ